MEVDWAMIQRGIFEHMREFKVSAFSKAGEKPRIRMAPRTVHKHSEDKIEQWLSDYQECVEVVDISDAIKFVRAYEMVPDIFDKEARNRPELTLDYGKYLNLIDTFYIQIQIILKFFRMSLLRVNMLLL